MEDKSVFVLATGGTISMKKTAEGYIPDPLHLEKTLNLLPELQNADMPKYKVHGYEKPIDSANMTLDDWNNIAEHIVRNYDDYSGFVILHGTDTMAYTASALAFILENLAKPVILTGSQLPLFETRNDARNNLINAILIAGNYFIPEVCLYFNDKLFRGNRATKMDASSFNAFASPNYPSLAKVGTKIRIRHDLIKRSHAEPTLKLMQQFIKPVEITSIKIFPGMSYDWLTHFLKLPLQALVLETFGVGNAPQDPRFLDLLAQATQKGMVIVNCSQCKYAKVHMKDYATGNALLRAGVISGADMTVEAVLSKLFYLFSKNLPVEEIKTLMVKNLRGELTP